MGLHTSVHNLAHRRTSSCVTQPREILYKICAVSAPRGAHVFCEEEWFSISAHYPVAAVSTVYLNIVEQWNNNIHIRHFRKPVVHLDIDVRVYR